MHNAERAQLPWPRFMHLVLVLLLSTMGFSLVSGCSDQFSSLENSILTWIKALHQHELGLMMWLPPQI